MSSRSNKGNDGEGETKRSEEAEAGRVEDDDEGSEGELNVARNGPNPSRPASTPSSTNRAATEAACLDDRISAKQRRSGPRATQPGITPGPVFSPQRLDEANVGAALRGIERDVLAKTNAAAAGIASMGTTTTPGAVAVTPSTGGRSGTSSSGLLVGTKASGRSAAEAMAAMDAAQARSDLSHLEDEVLAKTRAASDPYGSSASDEGKQRLPGSATLVGLQQLEGMVLNKYTSQQDCFNDEEEGGESDEVDGASPPAAAGDDGGADMAARAMGPYDGLRNEGGVTGTTTGPPAMSTVLPEDQSVTGAQSATTGGPIPPPPEESAPHLEYGLRAGSALGSGHEESSGPITAGVTHRTGPYGYPAMPYVQEHMPLDAAGGIHAYVADTPVVDASGVAIIDDGEVNREKRRRCARRGIWVALCLCIVVVAIVVPLALTGNGGNTDAKDGIAGTSGTMETRRPTSEPTAVPTSVPTTPNFMMVAARVEPLGTDLSDSTSAGFLAADWMANVDPSGFRDPSDPRFLQRFALAALYFSTLGDEWTRCSRTTEICPASQGKTEWMSDSDECSWAAVVCEDNFITSIIIAQTQQWNLGGSFAHEISYLSELTNFRIVTQGIGGTIPNSFENLTNLVAFSINDNELMSPIPPDLLLGSRETLKIIFMERNNFQGDIPKMFTQLPALHTFALEGNQFSGTIHPEFGLLQNLGVLYFGKNRLRGPVPDEFFDASSLSIVHLNNNELTGPISPRIGQLTELKTLNLSENEMNGTIPDELYDPALTKFRKLELSGNNFKGQLSHKIGILSSLEEIRLHDNMFTGTIPEELANATNLEVLTLHGNNFTGSIPNAICDLSYIKEIKVDCDKVNCTGCTRFNCTCG